ncbi:MAG: hypothetical protein AB2L11_11190 [Syntrophobacteraceae bacterium]
MKTMKIISLVCISLALCMVFTTAKAQAQCCYYFNPLLFPFAVAGAIVGTAATIVTGVLPGPVYHYPAYGGPYHAPPPAYYGPRVYYHYGSGRYGGHYYRHGYRSPRY